jgi:hypothetical protein
MKKLLVFLFAIVSINGNAQPSRWYSYPEHFKMINGSIGDTVNSIMWNKRDIRINGLSAFDTVWNASNALVLHPTFNEFNDINFYPGQMVVKPTNSYQLDSIMVRGYYARNILKPAIVDTLRFSIT